jgi:hypothetical protein
VSIQSKQNLPNSNSTTGQTVPSDLKAPRTLVDVTAAFTFSRLPQGERIAKILLAVLASRNAARKPAASVDSVELTEVELSGVIDLRSIGDELAGYADKKFCVRYGHLEDGNAKA